MFKIVEPKRFDIYIEDVQLRSDEVLIKVDYATICKADLRYYEGARNPRLLSLKYPMSLLHEATGIVLRDPQGIFKPNTRVVMIPNRVEKKQCEHCVCDDPLLGENYCPDAKFASSNCDGFSKEIISYPSKYIIAVPASIPNHYAVFSEMLSVAISTVRRITISQRTIAIWGDGVLGFFVAAVARFMYKHHRIVAIGKHPDKLKKFPVDQYYIIGEPIIEQIGLAFECVGGKSAASAIAQILELIKVGGEIVLTGVTEEEVPISTRKVLEKGLRLNGVTRSQRADFEQALQMLQNEEIIKLIDSLVLSDNDITSITEFYHVFEKELSNKELGKHLLHFKL